VLALDSQRRQHNRPAAVLAVSLLAALWGVSCSPAQGWQASRLSELVPHTQVPADLGSESARAEAGVACEVSTKGHNDLGGVWVEPTICLAAEWAPGRTFPGHFTTAITTDRILVHRCHKLVAQVCQHLVSTGEGDVG
jgi:hypothetical protein